MRGLTSLFAATLLTIAGAAHAGAPLTTAPISSTFADSDTLFCQAANVGKKDVVVLFESIDVNGAVVSSVTHTIPPGAVRGLQEGGTAQYCRFTGGTSKTLRAQAVYYDTADDRYLLSVPAQ